MKKVLSENKTLTDLASKRLDLFKSYAEKNLEVEEKEKELSEIGGDLYQNRRKMTMILKQQLLALIPKREKRALRILTKRASFEDLWGNSILVVLLFTAYPLPLTKDERKECKELAVFKEEIYGNVFTQWWFNQTTSLDVREVKEVLERIYKKYWANHIELKTALYENIDRNQESLFVDIKIL